MQEKKYINPKTIYTFAADFFGAGRKSLPAVIVRDSSIED